VWDLKIELLANINNRWGNKHVCNKVNIQVINFIVKLLDCLQVDSTTYKGQVNEKGQNQSVDGNMDSLNS